MNQFLLVLELNLMLRDNKTDRGDLEFPQPGNCGSQTLTQIPPSPTNTYRRPRLNLSQFQSAESVHENYFDSSDSDAKIESQSTRSDITTKHVDDDRDEEEYRDTLDLKRQLREERRASKKGLFFDMDKTDLESNLLDS